MRKEGRCRQVARCKNAKPPSRAAGGQSNRTAPRKLEFVEARSLLRLGGGCDVLCPLLDNACLGLASKVGSEGHGHRRLRRPAVSALGDPPSAAFETSTRLGITPPSAHISVPDPAARVPPLGCALRFHPSIASPPFPEARAGTRALLFPLPLCNPVWTCLLSLPSSA